MWAGATEQPAPLLSIIIDNYNYGRFLAEAIDSALAQNYRPLEVIVVDDGSQDDSRTVMAGYCDRIRPIYKSNAGQASAFNAGFAASQGDIIVFLDADDRLLPHTGEQVARLFAADMNIAKVHYRLAVIDAAGRLTGDIMPPSHRPLPRGDLRWRALASPDDIPWLPTSGNAFARRSLVAIFPVPEGVYRICADYYLSNLTTLFGTIEALDLPGGHYRVHGKNSHYTSTLNLDQTRQIILLTRATHGYLARLARALGYAPASFDADQFASVTYVAHRLVSLRLAPEEHPIAGERYGELVALGMRAAFGRSDLPLLIRCAFAVWLVAVALAPRPIIHWLTRQVFQPGQHGLLSVLRAQVGRLVLRRPA